MREEFEIVLMDVGVCGFPTNGRTREQTRDRFNMRKESEMKGVESQIQRESTPKKKGSGRRASVSHHTFGYGKKIMSEETNLKWRRLRPQDVRSNRWQHPNPMRAYLGAYRRRDARWKIVLL